MTISSNIDARHFREAYGRLDEAGTPTAIEIVGVCNDAFAAVATEFKRHGYGVENSDAAEELVGLILRFFLQSNPSFQGAIPAEAEAEAEVKEREEANRLGMTVNYLRRLRRTEADRIADDKHAAQMADLTPDEEG